MKKYYFQDQCTFQSKCKKKNVEASQEEKYLESKIETR